LQFISDRQRRLGHGSDRGDLTVGARISSDAGQ
jgi:hypothetical protein